MKSKIGDNGWMKTAKGHWEQYVGRRIMTIRGKDDNGFTVLIFLAFSGRDWRGSHLTLKKAYNAAERV
jgi:hypothetical protein